MAPKGDLVFTETFLKNLLKEAFIHPPTNLNVDNVLNMLQERSDELLFMRMPKFEVKNIEGYLDRILSQLKKILNLLKGKISKITVWRCLESAYSLSVAWFRAIGNLLYNSSVGSLRRNLQHYWDKLVIWAALVCAISIASYKLFSLGGHLLNRWFSHEVMKASSLVAKETVKEIRKETTDFVTACIKNNEHDVSQVSSSGLVEAFSEILPIIKKHIRHDDAPSGCFSLNNDDNDDENAALAFLKELQDSVGTEWQSGASSALAFRDTFKVCYEPGSDPYLITDPEAREHEELVLTIIHLLTAQKNGNANEVVKIWNPYTVVEVDAPFKTMALSSLQYLSDTYPEIKTNIRVRDVLARQNTLLGDIVDYGLLDGFSARFDRFFNDKEYHKSMMESDFLQLLEDSEALKTQTKPFLEPLLNYLDGNVTEAATNLRNATRDDDPCGPSGCVNSFPTDPFKEVTDILVTKMMCLPIQAEKKSLMNELIEVLPMIVTLAGYYGTYAIWKPIVSIADKFEKRSELQGNNEGYTQETQQLMEKMANRQKKKLEDNGRWQEQTQGQPFTPHDQNRFGEAALYAWGGLSGGLNGTAVNLGLASRMFANLSSPDDEIKTLPLNDVVEEMKKTLKDLERRAVQDAKKNELRTSDDNIFNKEAFYWFIAMEGLDVVGYLVVSNGTADLSQSAQPDAARNSAGANVNQDGAAPAARGSGGDNTSPGSPRMQFPSFANREEQNSVVPARAAGAAAPQEKRTTRFLDGIRRLKTFGSEPQAAVGAVAKPNAPLVFYDLVVDPKYREDGIGKKLIHDAIQKLEEKQQSRRMIVRVRPNDSVTQALYADAKFVRVRDEFDGDGKLVLEEWEYFK